MTRRPPALAILGFTIIVTVCTLSALAPWITAIDPTASSLFFLAPPSPAHWLGTDDLGRDIFARLLHGGRASLVIGIGAAMIATVIGAPIGIAAGYLGGRIDMIASQVITLFIALPGLVLALMVTAIVGPTLLTLTVVLGFVTWPRVARLTRGQALAIRETAYVEAARAAGASPVWIMRAHVLPNLAHVIAAQFALSVAYAIFTSASLSFLGLGAPPPTPDWGGMVRAGASFLAVNPLMSLAPSAAVALTVLGFYCAGASTK